MPGRCWMSRPGWAMHLVVALPFVWLAVFFLLPFALVLAIALGSNAPDLAPPVELGFSLQNFALLLTDDLYVAAWLSSLRIAATATVGTLLLGYPMAYAIARAGPRWRPILLMLVILPFWTSFLIRVYAWIGVLANNGLLEQFLRWLGFVHPPETILGTEWAVQLGIVYAYLPFMVLPLYAALEKLDRRLLEAAADLGASPWRAFTSVTLPLSLRGIVAGIIMVFVPSLGDYVTPDLLGGAKTMFIGNLIQNQFLTVRDWAFGSAVSTILILIVAVAIVIYLKYGESSQVDVKPA